MGDHKLKCKICERETNAVFNINFKAVPVCEACASFIFIQQAQWYVTPKTNTKLSPNAKSKSN